MRLTKYLVGAAATLVLSYPSVASATVYTGSLSNVGGIGGSDGTDGWDNATSNIALSWIVDDVQNVGFWTYEYTFSDNRTPTPRVVDRLLIEVSSDFTLAGDFNAVVGGTPVLGTYSSALAGDYADIPSSFRAIEFSGGTSSRMNIKFYTPRAPVWGDMYASDAGAHAWNGGFGNPDIDPAAAPANGSIDNNILRPDTSTATVVPEPGSILLLGAGLAGLFGRRLRK